MGAADYEAAAARVPAARELSGAGPEAAWDRDLTGAMRRIRRSVAEEQVLEELFEDLAR